MNSLVAKSTVVILSLTPFITLAESDNPSSVSPLFHLSIEELISVQVEVASLTLENELEVGSTVELITQKQWEQRGARRTDDALNGIISTLTLPTFGGGNALAIRGYATELSVRGVASLLDGVPLNTLAWGTATYDKPNIDLGVLERIEMIRGPGSTIYGSDAFHGVVSYKTFAATENKVSSHVEMGPIGYQQSNIQVSHGYNGFRINSAIASSAQSPQNREYRYTDVSTQESLTSDRDHQYNSQSIVVKLNDDQSADRSAFEVGYYLNQWSGKEYPGFGTHFFAGSSLSVDRDIADIQSQFQMLKLQYNWFFPNDVSLQARAFYWENEQNIIYDLTRAASHELFQEHEQHKQGASLTLRQSDNDWGIQWLASLATDFSKIDSTRVDRVGTDGTLLLDSEASYTGLTRTIDSALLQTKTHFFSAQVFLLLGVRVDEYSDFGEQVSPRSGLIWMASQSSAFKLLWGNAFRASVGGELEGSAEIRGNSNISPETIDTYEFIFMHIKPKWKISVTYFESSWQDGIVIRPLATPDENNHSSEYVNRGENNASGLEFEGKLLWEDLTFEGGASWVESKSSSEDLEYLAFPKYIISFDTHYLYHPKNITFSIFNRVHIDTLSGPIKANIQDPEPLDDYFRTDIGIRAEVNDQLDYFIHVHNIFNRDNALPSVWNAEGGVPQQERNFTVGVKFIF